MDIIDIELTLEEYVEAQVLAYLDELREQEVVFTMLTVSGWDCA
jgi:hypothetical protein